MNFDVLFVIWNFCEQKNRKKFILAYKPFYIKGKDYLKKTRTRRYPETRYWKADKILKEKQMVRKAINTQSDLFKYRLKPIPLLEDPANWNYYSINREGFLQAVFLENHLGKNMFYEFLKTVGVRGGSSEFSFYITLRFIGSQILFDTFKTLPMEYFLQALDILKGKIFNDIFVSSQRYKTTRKITPEMKKWLENLEKKEEFDFYKKDRLVYVFPGSVDYNGWRF